MRTCWKRTRRNVCGHELSGRKVHARTVDPLEMIWILKASSEYILQLFRILIQHFCLYVANRQSSVKAVYPPKNSQVNTRTEGCYSAWKHCGHRLPSVLHRARTSINNLIGFGVSARFKAVFMVVGCSTIKCPNVFQFADGRRPIGSLQQLCQVKVKFVSSSQDFA